MKLVQDDHNMILFECPGCGCMHYINNRWQITGEWDKPTVRPSIMVNRGLANPNAEQCHSFITDGRIEFLNDCTHELAGKTVELPDVK